MRTALLAVAAALIFAASGCHHHNLASNGCSSCGNGHAQHGRGQGLLANRHGANCNCQNGAHQGHAHGGPGQGGGLTHGGQQMDHVPRLPRDQRHGRHETGPAGPSSAAVGYPYYTTRGPRDFFHSNPPSIGP